MAITIVVTDPQPIFLVGLNQILSAEKDFQIAASCSCCRQALVEVQHHRPDMLLLDLDFKEGCGLQTIRRMQEEKLPTRPVIICARLTDEQVLEARRLKVPGIFLKNMPANLLAPCLRKVHAGGQWLEWESIGRALDQMLRRESGERRIATILTPREIEVLRLVGSGLANQSIADRLQLKEGTVKLHLNHIYQKLGLVNRVDLTLYAQRKGLI